MSDSSLYFVQWCPTCGRALRTRVSLLGKKVACHHCRSEFVTSSADFPCGPQRPPLNVQRADQLLAYFNAAGGRSPYDDHSTYAAGQEQQVEPMGAIPSGPCG